MDAVPLLASSFSLLHPMSLPPLRLIFRALSAVRFRCCCSVRFLHHAFHCGPLPVFAVCLSCIACKSPLPPLFCTRTLLLPYLRPPRAIPQVVRELLSYLAIADWAIKDEMVLKLAILAERFAPDMRWCVAMLA